MNVTQFQWFFFAHNFSYITFFVLNLQTWNLRCTHLVSKSTFTPKHIDLSLLFLLQYSVKRKFAGNARNLPWRRYLNIKLSHSMNGSNVWGSFGTFWWRPLLVQMEYLWEKLTSSVKWRIILVAVWKFQMTLGNYFFPGWFADCRQLCQFWKESIPFVVEYSIWTRGGRHHKAPMNPKHWIWIHSQNGITLC